VIEKLGYSVDETMQATGLGRTTIFNLIDTGELESIKVGRRRIIPVEAIREFFEAQRRQQAANES
jgi:excisionase family DNA binding protein